MVVMKRSDVLSVPTWEDYVGLEMSVLPIPHRQKRPDFAWKRLGYTNTHCLSDSDSGYRTLRRFFELGGDGLAVICGRPSENLFVIDCESIEALEEVRRQLIARDIDAPCVISGRGGHLYLRCREGAVKGVRAGEMKNVEVRGDGDLVVLPPTIHPSGAVYRWVGGSPPRNIPTVSVDDLDFLPFALVTSAKSSRRLHDDTRDYLRHGAAVGSRNNRLFDAARDYAYVGKDKIAAFADLLPVALRSGLDEREAAATILSAFKNLPARSNDTSQTDALKAFCANVSWGGRTGATDQRVFLALVQRRAEDVQRHTKGKFRATYRELQLMTGIKSHHTLRRSLKRLMCCGYIEHGGNEENGSSLWRFSDMVMRAGSFFCVQDCHINTAVSLRSNYCGTYAHLSKYAAAILDLLRNQKTAMTATDITVAVGCHRTTTKRNIQKLVSMGLVESDGDGYRAVDVPDGYDEQVAAASKHYVDKAKMEAQQAQDRAYFALGRLLDYLWHQVKQVNGVNPDD